VCLPEGLVLHLKRREQREPPGQRHAFRVVDSFPNAFDIALFGNCSDGTDMDTLPAINTFRITEAFIQSCSDCQFSPRFAKSKAPTVCTSLHTLIHLPQSTHLLELRTIATLVSSFALMGLLAAKRISLTPKSVDNFLNSQLLLFFHK